MANNINYIKFKKSRDSVFRAINDPLLIDKIKFPRFKKFNWALDWFDQISKDNNNIGLLVVDRNLTTSYTFEYLSLSSSQIANWLVRLGINKGTVVVVHLDNNIELFQIFIALIKIGTVIVPISTKLSNKEIDFRIKKCDSKYVITKNKYNFKEFNFSLALTIVNIDHKFKENYSKENIMYHAKTTLSTDLCFAYFTSGTTSKPKLVLHSHQSYAVGHLSSLLWNGLQKNDVHLNISSPGWAKHAWSSFFVPWNAEATNVVISDTNILDNQEILNIVCINKINTLCAPPTFWRKLVCQKLVSNLPSSLKQIVSAGEPLESKIIIKIQKEINLVLRNGYGQTEATAIIGQLPNSKLKLGSIGKPLPGYKIKIVNEHNHEVKSGELCIDLSNNPIGLMAGYKDFQYENKDNLYHTGDMCEIDSDGNIFFKGRNDFIFKAFDYKVSPYELEDIINTITGVESAVIVPSTDDVGNTLPRAYVTTVSNNYKELSKNIIIQTNLVFSKRFALKDVIICKYIPQTVTGKIDRKKLLDFSLNPQTFDGFIFMQANSLSSTKLNL